MAYAFNVVSNLIVLMCLREELQKAMPYETVNCIRALYTIILS